MIDTDALRKHIRFAVEHYGTRTQCEEHRLDQVADYLVTSFLFLHAADNAVSNIDNEETGLIIKVGL